MLSIKISNNFKSYSKCRVVFTGRKEEKIKKLSVFSVDSFYYNQIFPFFKKKIYNSKKNELISIYDQDNVEKITFFSLNNLDAFEKVRHFSANLINVLKVSHEIEIDFSNLKSIVNFLKLDLQGLAKSFIEGLFYGSYDFDKYLEDKKKKSQVIYLVDPPIPLGSIIREVEVINNAFSLAKDLVNEPPNVLNAVSFAKIMKKQAKDNQIKIEILKNKDLRKKNLSAILAVNAGSKEEARLVILKYFKHQAKQTIMLVGKGVTFDSGGLCLKPSKAMEGMKMDMSGAAVVLATLLATSQLNLPINLIGVTPLTDNLTGSNAFKVGDVIKTYSGKTVEVINTDAEGRLILADALSYGLKKHKVDYVIDLATLTGACLMALGSHYAGLFSNDEELNNLLLKSGEESGEKVWALPLDEVYQDELKSSIADLKNVGSAYGGAITAAKFLENFVNKKPWAHLDIASTMEHNQSKGYFKKGGSGFGVRLLITFLKKILNEKT